VRHHLATISSRVARATRTLRSRLHAAADGAAMTEYLGVIIIVVLIIIAVATTNIGERIGEELDNQITKLINDTGAGTGSGGDCTGTGPC
jgi:Flp pilus assembly pilin Flp